uniref:Uncharacterized protein n=1 Tax=Rhizophora mucronata TaxID=61149 RepID=A0A2P2IUS4_RHIMU
MGSKLGSSLPAAKKLQCLNYVSGRKR